MSHPEHRAQKPSSLPAIRAALATVPRRLGSEGICRRLLLATIPLLAALFLPLAAQAATFGEVGTGAGQLAHPSGLALDQSSGDLYVVDGENQRIDVFGPSAAFLSAFGFGVRDGAEESQSCTEASGCRRAIEGTGAGQLSIFGAGAVAVEPGVEPDFYVLDRNNHRIQKFDSEGHFLLAFGGDVVAHGPDNSANDETQSFTVAAEGGTFELSLQDPYEGESGGTQETAALPYDAAPAQVKAALEAIPALAAHAGTVSVAGGPGDPTGSAPYEVTFEGGLSGDDVPSLSLLRAGLGPAAPGAQLRCSSTTAAETVEYQWLRDGAPIPGATSPTYTATAADAGKNLQCQLTALDANAAETAISAEPAQRIAPAPSTPPPTKAGSINIAGFSSAPPVGGTGGELSCGTSVDWTGSPSLAYRWYRNGLPIPGATEKAVEITAAELAGPATFQCLVIATNAGGAVAAASLPLQTAPAPSPAPPVAFASLGEPTTLHQGGAPEVCRPADACKVGDTGAAAGQFAPWPAETGAGASLIAVAAGTVYVGDTDRVQEFDSAGDYTGQLSLPGAGQLTGLAVNSAGDVYVIAAGLSGVHEYEPDGAEIGSPLDPSGHPQALTIGPEDEIYVRDYDSARNAVQVLAYDHSGAQTALIRAPEVTTGVTAGAHDGGLALDQAAQRLYLSDPSAEDIVELPLPPPGPGVEEESEQAAEVLSTDATAEAEINPHSRSTTFHLQYLTERAFQHNQEEGREGFAGALETPESAPIGSDFAAHPVAQPLTGLAPETAYRFRFLATNEKGTVPGEAATFTTQPPARFSLDAPTSLGPGSATLHAYLDPEGLETHYRLQYEEAGAAEPFSNPISTPEATLPAAAAFASLPAVPVSALRPATEYRFRLLAANSAGTLASPPFVFETAPASCPNQPLRVENDSTALPQCRAYEQVSPPEKGGYGVSHAGIALAPSGQRALFRSIGTFAANPTDEGHYVSRRTAAGWLTEGIDPPPALGPSFFGKGIIAASEDLGQFSTAVLAPGVAETALSTATAAADFFRAPGGAFFQASPTIHRADGEPFGSDRLAGGVPIAAAGVASPDLSHIVLQSQAPLLPADTVPPGGPGSSRLYEIAAAGTPAASLRLVSVDEEGHSITPCNPSGGVATIEAVPRGSSNIAQPDSISADGSTIFFYAASPSFATGCVPGSSEQLFARIGGAQTLELSQPSPGECGPGPAPAEASCRNAPAAAPTFADASADGRLAFFFSTQQLTDDATEDPHQSDGTCESVPQGSGCNLYEYDFSRPAGHNLIDVSAGNTGGAGPQAHAVLGVSRDGSHLYFTAGGVLTTERNALGAAARPGADNLYVYDTEDETTAFVATLCSGAPAPQCPGSGSDVPGLVGNKRYDITPDGRYLLFTTYAQLTPDDENEAADVYRYDSLTGTLLRLSTGHDGFDSNGNGGGQDATASSLSGVLNGASVPDRAISDDGSTVVFYTARPLEESDTDTKVDAYEWHLGEVSLLSGGASPTDGGEDVSVSASGADILFSTAQGLIPSDVDGLPDLYDARVDGGFPLPPPGPPTCEGAESCHGAGTHEGPPPLLGSEGFRGPPEGPDNPHSPACKKGFAHRHGSCVKVRRHHHKKRHHKRAGSNHGGKK